QPPGGLRDLVDRLVKRLGVSARRAGRTADLSHELQRGLPHLIVSCRWLKIMEHSDVAAHASDDTRDAICARERKAPVNLGKPVALATSIAGELHDASSEICA